MLRAVRAMALCCLLAPTASTPTTRWDDAVARLARVPLAQRAAAVNVWVNANLRYSADAERGQTDEWSAPLETLLRGSGDCEDYAVLKYALLRASGAVAPAEARLAYGWVSLEDVRTPHLVAIVRSPAGPLVLDNLLDELKPPSERGDLQLSFSMSDRRLYDGLTDTVFAPVERLQRWHRVVRLMQRQQLYPTPEVPRAVPADRDS